MKQRKREGEGEGEVWRKSGEMRIVKRKGWGGGIRKELAQLKRNGNDW